MEKHHTKAEKPAAVESELVLKKFTIDRMQRDLNAVTYDNQRLLAHIRRIEAEAAQNKRIRYIVRQLFRALNAAALARIKRLDRSETNAPSLRVSKNESRAEILRKIRMYDAERYIPNQPTISFRVVYKTYRLGTKTAVFIAGIPFRAARAIKRI